MGPMGLLKRESAAWAARFREGLPAVAVSVNRTERSNRRN
jgi:hypothetical protein